MFAAKFMIAFMASSALGARLNTVIKDDASSDELLIRPFSITRPSGFPPLPFQQTRSVQDPVVTQIATQVASTFTPPAIAPTGYGDEASKCFQAILGPLQARVVVALSGASKTSKQKTIINQLGTIVMEWLEVEGTACSKQIMQMASRSTKVVSPSSLLQDNSTQSPPPVPPEALAADIAKDLAKDAVNPMAVGMGEEDKTPTGGSHGVLLTLGLSGSVAGGAITGEVGVVVFGRDMGSVILTTGVGLKGPGASAEVKIGLIALRDALVRTRCVVSVHVKLPGVVGVGAVEAEVCFSHLSPPKFAGVGIDVSVGPQVTVNPLPAGVGAKCYRSKVVHRMTKGK